MGGIVSINKRIDEISQLEPEAALTHIKELLREHPDEAEAWSLQGSLYARCGNYDEAIKNLNKAIALSPQRAGFYFRRGRYNLKSGNVSEAINDLSEALSKDNRNDITFTEALYFHRAEALIKLGKKQEALSDLSHIPENYQTWTFKLRSKADLIADCNAL